MAQFHDISLRDMTLCSRFGSSSFGMLLSAPTRSFKSHELMGILSPNEPSAWCKNDSDKNCVAYCTQQAISNNSEILEKYQR